MAIPFYCGVGGATLNPAKGRPLVSIGVPVYNGQETIREALESVLQQTYDNLEIVICDNASTDATGAICREYAARDKRIKYYLNDTNIGANPNANRVCKLSTGEYFTLANADDIRPPTAVADCLEGYRKNPDAVLVHGSILYDTPDRDELVEIRNLVDLSSPSALKRVVAYTRGLRTNEISYGLYRRDALIRSNTWYGNHYGTETLMLLRLCFVGPIERIESPMLIYRAQSVADSPMGPVRLITLRNLLLRRGCGRMKCWIVLSMGCYYLATCPEKSVGQRSLAVVAFAGSFATRFRSHLVREALLFLSTPATWLVSLLRPAGRMVRTAFMRRRATGR